MIKKQRIKPVNKKCSFCESKETPSWQLYDKLREFLSARGRIKGSRLTGVCVHHQRLNASAIKQARHLGLLPFLTQ